MNQQWNVKVYCLECGLVFWEGDMILWACELRKHYVPIWFTKARLHEDENEGHEVMVEYPSCIVSLMNPAKKLRTRSACNG